MKKGRNTTNSISLGNYIIKQYIEQVDNSRLDKKKVCSFSVVLFQGTRKVKSSYHPTKTEANKAVKNYVALLKDFLCQVD